jgi:hypothetical protein
MLASVLIEELQSLIKNEGDVNIINNEDSELISVGFDEMTSEDGSTETVGVLEFED